MNFESNMGLGIQHSPKQWQGHRCRGGNQQQPGLDVTMPQGLMQITKIYMTPVAAWPSDPNEMACPSLCSEYILLPINILYYHKEADLVNSQAEFLGKSKQSQRETERQDVR